MEPPRGFLALTWNFICFLPYFIGLLILGVLKGRGKVCLDPTCGITLGVILCPFIFIIIIVGNSALILGLWPAHLFYTFYCLWSTKQLGPALKSLLSICVLVVLLLWPLIGIASSIVGGVAYGFLSPVFATFQAVGGKKTDAFFHSIYDGTWDTVEGNFTIVRDVRDVLYHSYFSIMDDLRLQGPPGGKYYEIRFFITFLGVIAISFFLVFDFTPAYRMKFLSRYACPRS